MDLGSRIRTLRTERQLSQEAVADRLHVSRQAVAKWENGASLPSTANLLALCALFGVPPEQLTAPEQTPSLPRKHIRSPYLLFAAALILLAAGGAAYFLQPRLPGNLIGYADAATSLYVSAPSPLPVLLAAGAALLALAGGVLLFRARRRRGRK